jgi:hypothetical protein
MVMPRYPNRCGKHSSAPLFRDRSCHYRYAAATGLTTHTIQKSGAERKQCLAAEIGFGL